MAEELMHKAIVAIHKPLTQLLNVFPPTLSITGYYFFKKVVFHFPKLKQYLTGGSKGTKSRLCKLVLKSKTWVRKYK